ncbi:SRPBCC family protein [Pedobacter sp. GSP4]|uniref:SRPBCC family protein n=1 Tax=Pedobacter sp. GSP4 TaxID=3453716 RepID=UPI003EEC8614
MKSSNEQAISGKQNGLISLGEQVTWQAKHFGIPFKMTSKITFMEAPTLFIDEMISGPFIKLHHQHLFKTKGTQTDMTDVFEFHAPFGILGEIAEQLFLKRYMEMLLIERNCFIKAEAEHNHK